MKKVVVIEPIGFTAKQLDIFINQMKASNFEVQTYSAKPGNLAEAAERVKDANIIITANYPLPQEVLQNSKDLEFISVAFTGVDHLNLSYCKSKNIQVSNSAGYSTEAVAELTIGLMIGAYRNFISGHQQTITGKDRNGFLGKELKNKVVGIIGTGAIGQKVIEFLKVFGCKIIACSRTEKPELKSCVEYCSLDSLLEKSDIVSLHLPLNENTKHLLNEEKLAKLKKECFLINTARGGIIDNYYLSKLLKENKIAGAAIDVYDTEPPLRDNHPLLGAPNTILLPHVGYATKEAIFDRAEIVTENIFAYLAGHPQNLC